jgi:hypothetical protein
MSRQRAFLAHLLISAVIVGALAAIVLLLWYPPDLFRLGNLGRLIGIIALVDVVVGPVITLIVFRSGKPGLTMDLAIIGALQAALLVYGLHVLLINRPVFMVWVGDRFELVTPRDIADVDLQRAPDRFRSLSWTGPRFVAVSRPEDPAALQALTLEALGGRDIHTQPGYFVDFDAVPASDLSDLPAVDQLVPRLTAQELAALDSTSRGRPAASLKYAPITSSARLAATMLLDARSGQVLEVLDVDPWIVSARPEPAR